MQNSKKRGTIGITKIQDPEVTIEEAEDVEATTSKDKSMKTNERVEMIKIMKRSVKEEVVMAMMSVTIDE